MICDNCNCAYELIESGQYQCPNCKHKIRLEIKDGIPTEPGLYWCLVTRWIICKVVDDRIYDYYSHERVFPSTILKYRKVMEPQ